jgi:integrase
MGLPNRIDQDNVVKFRNRQNIKPVEQLKKCTKLNKNGELKQTPCNSKKGEPHEVYPIKDKEQVKAMEQYFRNKVNEANGINRKKAAFRNLMMWVIGINLGLRASDLLELRWGDLLYSDGTYKDGSRKNEQKTDKFKTFWFNKYVVDIIKEYLDEFHPCTDLDLHVFRSPEGGSIEVRTATKILKDAAEACEIKVNVGTHSMRKTFGYHFYNAHRDDVNALTHLQRLFNHSSPQVTLAYIGIEDEESKQYYYDMTW